MPKVEPKNVLTEVSQEVKIEKPKALRKIKNYIISLLSKLPKH
jgi:hypothetical protein